MNTEEESDQMNIIDELVQKWKGYQGGEFMPNEAEHDVTWWLETIAAEMEKDVSYQGHEFYASRWLRRKIRENSHV